MPLLRRAGFRSLRAPGFSMRVSSRLPGRSRWPALLNVPAEAIALMAPHRSRTRRFLARRLGVNAGGGDRAQGLRIETCPSRHASLASRSTSAATASRNTGRMKQYRHRLRGRPPDGRDQGRSVPPAGEERRLPPRHRERLAGDARHPLGVWFPDRRLSRLSTRTRAASSRPAASATTSTAACGSCARS